MAKLQTTRVRDKNGDPDFKYIINERDFDPKKHERLRRDLSDKDSTLAAKSKGLGAKKK